jgi:hypothetical protein
MQDIFRQRSVSAWIYYTKTRGKIRTLTSWTQGAFKELGLEYESWIYYTFIFIFKFEHSVQVTGKKNILAGVTGFCVTMRIYGFNSFRSIDLIW